MLFGSRRVYGTLLTALGLFLIVSLTFGLIGVWLFQGRYNFCLRCEPNENGYYFKSTCLVVSDSLNYCNQSTCEAYPFNVTGGPLQVCGAPRPRPPRDLFPQGGSQARSVAGTMGTKCRHGPLFLYLFCTAVCCEAQLGGGGVIR